MLIIFFNQLGLQCKIRTRGENYVPAAIRVHCWTKVDETHGPIATLLVSAPGFKKSFSKSAYLERSNGSSTVYISVRLFIAEDSMFKVDGILIRLFTHIWLSLAALVQTSQLMLVHMYIWKLDWGMPLLSPSEFQTLSSITWKLGGKAIEAISSSTCMPRALGKNSNLGWKLYWAPV